jgi:hypothetical protein
MALIRRGYSVCFGRSAAQIHISETDATKNAIEIPLGVRHVAAAISAARTLADVEAITGGFTRDSDLFPGAVFVHEFKNGEVCSATSHPRQASVAYFCDPALGDNASRMLVKEPSPCYYVIAIYAGMFCKYVS